MTVPQILEEAHRIRKHLRELKSEIDLGPRVAKIQQTKLDADKLAHQQAHEHITKLKLKIREEEGNLKQANTQLAKFEKQLNDAGSPKEYEAKQNEIRMAKAKVDAIEELLLNTMEELEQKTADLPNVDKKWAEDQADYAQNILDGKERLERLQDDQKLHVEKLAKLDAELAPPAVKMQYDRLIKTYGPDGLAGVLVRSCQQCRNAISEQQRNDIVAGKFVCCSTCGRALYVMKTD